MNENEFAIFGKNQWKKENKLEEETEQKTLWNIPPKQKVIDERHRCPEKGGEKRKEKATEENDDERIELMNIFKSFIRNESKIERTEKLKMRINSLKLVLERTIGGILEFARKIGTKIEQKREFTEEIEKWENKRREIEEKAGQKKMDGKMNNWLMWICLMYELGTKMVEGMAKNAAQNGSLMVEAWRKYAKEKHIADIIKVGGEMDTNWPKWDK
ncbi:hypothetical protein niasHT_016729 [Heterodera trifolii]|uniref:Uncharacterized protein n=2 Tax=Heterodera trifolii TaxID=157864 RepID=A0ABD2KU97_9BILA